MGTNMNDRSLVIEVVSGSRRVLIMDVACKTKIINKVQAEIRLGTESYL